MNQGAARGVIVCKDNVEQLGVNKEHVRRTVLHELIHAYDHCRAKIDSRDCQHLACTEVRAALLSGDCDMTNEWKRRNFRIKGQGAECAKRRAELSVAQHECCKGEGAAKAAVERVFDRCYADTAPFEAKF
jgi:mitochondrial inner membrane protease ATP23